MEIQIMETQLQEVIQRLERLESLTQTHLLKEKRWLTVQEFALELLSFLFATRLGQVHQPLD
jgi:hypothetical protein